MRTINKLKILKIIKIVVSIIFVPILVFYLGIIVPEYLACNKAMFEGQKGFDIWGSEIDCDCESQEFGEAFFQMFSLILGIFSAILLLVFLLNYQIKKNNTTKQMKKIISILFIFSCLKSNAQKLKNCSICSTQIIKDQHIKGMSIDEIRFITNDLYARKGYKFKTAEVDSFYSDKTWYKPVSDNSKIIFNEIEKQNIKLFQDKTTEIKKEREKLIYELKNFKSALLALDNLTLSSKYSYHVTGKDYNEQYKHLTETLKKINLDDVNWSLNVGIYKVTIDNGAILIDYQILIGPDGFSIKYGNQGTSEIAKQLYPNDQITEFTFWWEFEWKNDKIKFLKMNVAG